MIPTLRRIKFLVQNWQCHIINIRFIINYHLRIKTFTIIKKCNVREKNMVFIDRNDYKYHGRHFEIFHAVLTLK